MKRALRVGDRVSWNSEAGRVTGVIKKKITTDTLLKGRGAACLTGRPSVCDQERTDGSRGDPQGSRAAQDQKNSG